MKNLILLIFLMTISICSKATIVIPPANLAEVAYNSDLVIYAKAESHQNGNVYINNFRVLEVIKGNVSKDDIVAVEEYSGGQLNGMRTVISGDVDFKLGYNYILFLSQVGTGNYKTRQLSMGVFEEGKLDKQNVIGRTGDILDIALAGGTLYNYSELTGLYRTSDFVNHLRAVMNGASDWNYLDAGFVVYDNTGQSDGNNFVPQGQLKSVAPCPNEAPCHCTTLFGPPGASQTKYEDNNWTVCVAGGAQDDPTTSTEIADLQTAIGAMNGMTGINISYTGVDAAATPITCGPCLGGGITGAACDAFNFAAGSCNKMYVFFDDPCMQIPDVNPANCSGTLGIGGHFASGTHVDECGDTWQTACVPYFVMNNFGVCAPSTVNQNDYIAVLIHEMLHAVGVGHHYDASAFTTTDAANNTCGAAGANNPANAPTGTISHDGNECSGIMNPVICNSPSPTAPDFSITALDNSCTDWMYNITADAACTVDAGEPTPATADVCDTDLAAVDVTTVFADPGVPGTPSLNQNYVIVDPTSTPPNDIITVSNTAVLDLTGLAVGDQACVTSVAYTQETLDIVTAFLDAQLATICVPVVGTPCASDLIGPFGTLDLSGFLNGLNGAFETVGFNFTSDDIALWCANQEITIPLSALGVGLSDFVVDLTTIPGLEPDGFCCDFSTDTHCLTVISCGACLIENVTSTDAMCNGDNAEYEICFDVTEGSGDYNIVDTDAGNAVLFNQAGLPTDTDPAIMGDEVCITVTIAGPTMAAVLNVDVVDNTDAMCIGGMPVGVAVPACPATACEAAAPVVSNDGGDCPADGDGSGDNTPFVFMEDGTGNMNAPYITEYIVLDGATGNIVGVFTTLADAEAAANTEATTNGDACIQAINHNQTEFMTISGELTGCIIASIPQSTLTDLWGLIQVAAPGTTATIADIEGYIANGAGGIVDLTPLGGPPDCAVSPFCYVIGNEDCVTAAACCPVITMVDMPADGCSATTQTICVTYDQDPTGVVMADINGVMGTITGNQICYDIPLENTTCEAIMFDIIHNATCVDDGSDILLTDGTNTNGLNLGPVMVFPVYQVTNPADDTGTCGAFTVNLMSSNLDGTPNTMCQTATLNCMADGDMFTIDYTAAPDPVTNPIPMQITDADILACSGTLSLSSGTCAMCPTTCDPSIATFIAPPVVIASESECPDGMNLSGGMLGAAVGCPAGSMVQYSVDGGPFSTSVPMYNQTTSETITTQCVCTVDADVVSMSTDVTTTPGACVCEIQAMIVDESCNDGGDDDPSNDMITFTVAIIDNGNGSATGWMDDQVAAPQSDIYGNTATYTLMPNSSLMITYTDASDPDCMTSITLVATDCETSENIPTVGEWGLIILALLMSIVAVIGIKQRERELA